MRSFKKEIRSVKGKAITLAKVGIDPYLEGKHNFENENIDIELLASERKDICLKCPLYEDEHYEACQVTDKNIPELTNKMCGKCFCILAYKLRQSIEKCELWKE